MTRATKVKMTSAALCLTFLSLTGSTAFAASDMMGSHMTKHQMRMMQKCKMMSHDMMMHNSRCMKMMGMHSKM